ncbi:MAG TPA: CCA tRNA nucleotidyltransferase [Gemmatimonadaceae bacterium]|nr:CCA tRNA nucleotidyltransferase [Gemmatimonadaceae bacterium]
MTRLHPPTTVLEIAERLESEGFEAWCVGGAIRDALLGETHLDWDLATSATPDEVRRVFGARRTIPVGIEFGTVGVLDRLGAMHEVTTFRRDVQTDGRHAVVEFGASLDDDLARRDFTINAIAYSPSSGELRDPFGGREDLAARIVRAVGDPDARMREDRLRALRGIRFAARFGFRIDDATRRAMEASAPYLGRLSPERVKQELDKTFDQVCRPSDALIVWQKTGAFASLIPALSNLPEQALTVPDFTARPGLERRPARRAVRYAALLAPLGAGAAESVLLGLRGSKHEIRAVTELVAAWQRNGPSMGAAMSASGTPDDASVRRWVASISRLGVGSFMRLAAAMWAADLSVRRPAPAPNAVRRLHRRMLGVALHDPIDLGGLAVDGDDLRRAGIPAGPGLGKILQSLLAAVIEDPARNTPDWLLREAARLHHDATPR